MLLISLQFKTEICLKAEEMLKQSSLMYMYAVNAEEIEPVCEELDEEEDRQRKTIRAASPFIPIFKKNCKGCCCDSNKTAS